MTGLKETVSLAMQSLPHCSCSAFLMRRHQTLICRLTFTSSSLTYLIPFLCFFPTTFFFKVISHSAPSHNFIYISSPIPSAINASAQGVGKDVRASKASQCSLSSPTSLFAPSPSAAPFVARTCVNIIAESVYVPVPKRRLSAFTSVKTFRNSESLRRAFE